jgi:hypothetical protein
MRHRIQRHARDPAAALALAEDLARAFHDPAEGHP